MRVLPSALKHGVTVEDILHALTNHMWSRPRDDLTFYFGPARDGALLEVGVVLDDDPRVVHAMQIRRRDERERFR